MDQELYSGREGTFSQLYQQRTLLLQDLKPNSVLLEPFKEEGTPHHMYIHATMSIHDDCRGQ